MSITFRCEHCHKEVKAPDNAGGRRAKCPFCHQSTYIPSPVSDEDVLPLAPIDEEEERREKEKIQALYEQEHDLLAETGSGPQPPLEHREDLTPGDLHHFVVNFCLEMARGNTEAAEDQAERLSKFGQVALEAVEELASGKVHEPALDALDRRTRQQLFNSLRGKLG